MGWWKAHARGALEEAVDTRNVNQLRSAIREGEGLGLSDDDLRAARGVLDEEDQKTAARHGMQETVDLKGSALPGDSNIWKILKP